MNSNDLQNFLDCMKGEEYYEAHDILEHLWFPRRFEKTNELNLIKGYINAAVSFELYKRGKPESAKKIYKTYLKYKDLRALVNESEHANKYREIEECIENIRENSAF